MDRRELRPGCLMLAIVAVGAKFAIPAASNSAAERTGQECQPVVPRTKRMGATAHLGIISHHVHQTFEFPGGEDSTMFLSRIKVSGLRASAEHEIVCDLPGRFSVLLGANGAGKTTLSDAIYLAHPSRFPSLPRQSASALGPTGVSRQVSVEYSLNADIEAEGRLGRQQSARYSGAGDVTNRWSVTLNRELGSITTKRDPAFGIAQNPEAFKLIYLPAWRHPLDELARREARILIELLRAQQQRLDGSRSLVPLRIRASHLLEQLAKDDVIDSVEERIRGHLATLSAGVSPQWPYIRGQVVDDSYLARVLELMLAVMEGRTSARPLEVSGLGYVNLLHIAVTLAAIPDSAEWVDQPQPATGEHTVEQGPDETDEEIHDRLLQAHAEAESEEDSFFPSTPFHATVVIEEPEAHLHPQLQHALTRYLRKAVQERPELQVILSSHATDVITSCTPEELVVIRKTERGSVCRPVAHVVPERHRTTTLRMARLHLDGSRSAAMFAERLVLVEGVTEATILREFGRAWAGQSSVKQSFVDALSIVPMGTKVGQWAVHLLATPGAELCARLAILRDSDQPFMAAPRKPGWLSDHDPEVVDAFISHPTLEPAITPGNENLISAALQSVDLELSDVSPEAINNLFRSRRKGPPGQPDLPAGRGSKRKAEFALALAGLLMEANDAQKPVSVPRHFRQLFDFLYYPAQPEPLGPIDPDDLWEGDDDPEETYWYPSEDEADVSFASGTHVPDELGSLWFDAPHGQLVGPAGDKSENDSTLEEWDPETDQPWDELA
ncbi:ATP-dependent endonuclease [Streptomyces sp. NPDC058321]|uniref:ATP-dependent nuclease n=1 Tax=Streptomyces sp. NPDC058321 TaxID=3346445 RepID=UPI0036F102F6